LSRQKGQEGLQFTAKSIAAFGSRGPAGAGLFRLTKKIEASDLSPVLSPEG
jgi:hypothetical protein